MLNWIKTHKYFELAVMLSGVFTAIGILTYSNMTMPLPEEVVVQHARDVSVKVLLPKGQGHGSGVVLTEDGRIITNQHVCGGNKEVTVENTDGMTFRAKVLWRALQTDYDLCLLQAEEKVVFDGRRNHTYKWEHAEFSTARLWAGMPVLHVGNMLSVRELIAFGTLGKLTATGWNKQPAYVFTGTAGPGSSGGGVFDLDGKLIGLIYSGHHLVVGYPRPVRVPVGVAQVLPADFILHLLGRG